MAFLPQKNKTVGETHSRNNKSVFPSNPPTYS